MENNTVDITIPKDMYGLIYFTANSENRQEIAYRGNFNPQTPPPVAKEFSGTGMGVSMHDLQNNAFAKVGKYPFDTQVRLSFRYGPQDNEKFSYLVKGPFIINSDGLQIITVTTVNKSDEPNVNNDAIVILVLSK